MRTHGTGAPPTLILETALRLERVLKPFDASGIFQPTGEGGGFRRLAVRGASLTVLSQGVVFAIQTVATFVLARLLTPADFGVVTMVTTFSLLLMSFGQNGYTEAILQRDEMDHSWPAICSGSTWVWACPDNRLCWRRGPAGKVLRRSTRSARCRWHVVDDLH